MSGPAAHEDRSRRSARAVLVALTATFVGVLVVWAAAAGPDRVLRDAGQREPYSTRRPFSGDVPSVPPHVRPATGTPHDEGWVGVVLSVLLGLLLAGVVTVLVTVLVAALRDRRLERRRPPADDGLEGDPIAVVGAAIRADTRAQLDLLEGGTPRNGVVACWHRFEQQADAAGLARRPAETSSEFTLRLLDLVEADASAVAVLASLYREARFSEHELTEDDRDRARAALTRIHIQLGGLLAVDLR